MNPCRALHSHYLSEEMCLLWVLADAGGVEISFGVLESSLSVLEEEELKDGVSVSSLEAFFGGER